MQLLPRTLLIAAAMVHCVAAAGVRSALAGSPVPDEAATRPGAGPEDEAALEKPDWTVERVVVFGNESTSTSLIKSILGVSPGSRWDEKAARVARLRLLTTGYFQSVELVLERGAEHGMVVLVVRVEERSTILLSDLFFASSRVVPLAVGLELADTNFLGMGMYFSGGFVAGVGQAGFRFRWHEPALFGTRLGSSAGAVFIDALDFFGYRCRTVIDPEADTARECRGQANALPGAVEAAPLHYRRLGGFLGLSYHLASFTFLYLDVRLETLRAEFDARARTAAPEGMREPVDFSIHYGRSLLASAVFTLETDTRDHPYLPRTGFLVSASAEGGVHALGSDYQYFKLVAHFQNVWRVRRKDALKLDLVTGAIFGSTPFFNKFFVGDVSELVPQRNLGVAMSARSAAPILSSTVSRMRYEDLAARVSLEYAIKAKKDPGPYIYGIDFFVRLGLFAIASAHHLKRVGDDLGVPLDLTFDVGLRVDTSIGDFGLSLGNAIGVIAF